jgi:hypothetical protein
LSKFTEDNQKEMLVQNRIVLKVLFKQQAEWTEERTLMFTELSCSQTIDRPENPRNKSKNFKMVNPIGYCDGENELHEILKTLWSNFACHKHLFPRGNPEQVKYAVSFLDCGKKLPHMTP